MLLRWLLTLMLASDPADELILDVDERYCLERDSVREAVARYLGRDIYTVGLGSVTARAAVERHGKAQTLTVLVELPDPHGRVERRLEVDSCADAVDAAGLIISVALDPLHAVSAWEPEPETEPATVVPPSTEPEQVPPPDLGPVAKSSLGGQLRALAGFGLGLVPGPSFGPSLALALTIRRVQVVARGHYWAPKRVPLAAAAAGADLQVGTAGLLVCYAPTVGPVEFPSCVGVDAGGLRGRGYGLERNRVALRPVVGLAIDQAIHWRMNPRFGLWMEVGVGVALTSPVLIVDDVGPLFEARPVAFRAGLGPTFRF